MLVLLVYDVLLDGLLNLFDFLDVWRLDVVVRLGVRFVQRLDLLLESPLLVTQRLGLLLLLYFGQLEQILLALLLLQQEIGPGLKYCFHQGVLQACVGPVSISPLEEGHRMSVVARLDVV